MDFNAERKKIRQGGVWRGNSSSSVIVMVIVEATGLQRRVLLCQAAPPTLPGCLRLPSCGVHPHLHLHSSLIPPPLLLSSCSSGSWEREERKGEQREQQASRVVGAGPRPEEEEEEEGGGVLAFWLLESDCFHHRQIKLHVFVLKTHNGFQRTMAESSTERLFAFLRLI